MGRPRKDGTRFPSGKLRPVIDAGHEMLLAHRSAMTGGAADPRDPRHGYPLGVLHLRGEITAEQHQAGLIYGCIRALAGPRGGCGETHPDEASWGRDWHHVMPHLTRSELASVVAEYCQALDDIDDTDRTTQARRCAKQVREALLYITIEGRRPVEILEAVVVHQTVGAEAHLSRRDHQALCVALDRLCRLWKIERPEKGDACSSGSARSPRRPSHPVIISDPAS